MKKLLLIIPVLFLLFNSCKKTIFSGRTFIHGQVTIEHINQPVYKAKVALISFESSFLGPGKNFRTEEVVYTDMEGFYTIKFHKDKIEKGRNYYLSSWKAAANVYPANIYYVNPKKDLEQDIKLPAKGWAKMKFINLSGDSINSISVDGLIGLPLDYYNHGLNSKDSFIIGYEIAGVKRELRAVFDYIDVSLGSKIIDKEVILLPFDTLEITYNY